MALTWAYLMRILVLSLHILIIYLAYLGRILHKSCTYLGRILGISWAYFELTFSLFLVYFFIPFGYIWFFFGVSLMYFKDIIYIFVAHQCCNLGVSLAFLGHILGISWAYL